MSLWKLLTARWGSGAGEVDEVRIDASTNSLQTIEYEHHEVHAGSSFNVHIKNTTAATDNHRTLLGFETPNTTKYAHLIVSAACSHAAEVFLYEDVTIDDDEGTEVTILDRNRVTDNTSTMLSFENPAVAGQATWMDETEIAGANFSATRTLERFQMVAGGGPKAIGGETRGSQEWVLKPNTKYAVVVQNVGANANLHEIHMDWYEHTDKH